jgi:hypothetical protein
LTYKYLLAVVETLVFMGKTVLGGGAPVGGVATEAAAADVGGDNEDAAEVAAEIFDFCLTGRSFPVTSEGLNVQSTLKHS